MKAVHVQYFAILREQRGAAAEKLETDAPDPGALYAELRQRYGFTLPVERVRAAVNGDFVPISRPLRAGYHEFSYPRSLGADDVQALPHFDRSGCAAAGAAEPTRRSVRHLRGLGAGPK